MRVLGPLLEIAAWLDFRFGSWVAEFFGLAVLIVPGLLLGRLL